VQPSERTLAPEAASRAQRLAFDLQRDQVQASARLQAMRMATIGAAVPTPARSLPSDRPVRLGDAYRRPSVAARPAGGRA
jgi:hypothetical protein